MCDEPTRTCKCTKCNKDYTITKEEYTRLKVDFPDLPDLCMKCLGIAINDCLTVINEITEKNLGYNPQLSAKYVDDENET